jgi:hypothetical protein
VQRVPLAAASVCRDDAVLLVNEVTRDVTAWIGADCGVFAASLAKQVSLQRSNFLPMVYQLSFEVAVATQMLYDQCMLVSCCAVLPHYASAYVSSGVYVTLRSERCAMRSYTDSQVL